MIQRIIEQAAHEAEHAHHAIAPGKQIDGQRHVAFVCKTPRDVTDVIVQPEGFVNDNYRRMRAWAFRRGEISFQR